MFDYISTVAEVSSPKSFISWLSILSEVCDTTEHPRL